LVGAVWIYVWVFYSIPLVFMSVFVKISYCFYCYGFVVYLEVRNCDIPAVDFLLRTALAIQGLLCFHINFRIDFSLSVKNVRNFEIGVALNLWIVFSSIVILTMLICGFMSMGELSTF
jgi:hypothetical protein